MTEDSRAHSFGLVAGLGVGAGIFYYKSLVEAHLQRGLVPRILMVHADVRKVTALAGAREVEELSEYLAGLLRQLANAGAEVATIPAFSPQVCAKELDAKTPLPLISLLDAIAHEVTRREMKRVAVLGARVTMETRLYGSLRDVDVILPSEQELDRMADLYGSIVYAGRATIAQREELRALAHKLIAREHLDGILLAGTDLSFVFTPANTDFPHVDGARVHIEAIMRELSTEFKPHPELRKHGG